MHHLPRYLLAALLLVTMSANAFAQPVKVQLPKDAPPKPKDPPARLTAEQMKGPDRKRMAAKGLFQLDFDKVDIDKLVQTISDMTGKLFILPDNIRGKITIIGPEHGKVGVTADEAYAAFLSALDANGLAIYPAGKYMKIVEKRAAKQNNVPTLLDEDAPYTTNEQLVTKLFKLNYVEAEPVRAVIQQLVSRDGDSIAFPPDIIIVNDVGLNMHRLERIIDRLDSVSSNDEIRVIQIQYASATDISEKLKQIFEDKNKKPGQRGGRATISPGSMPSGAPGMASPPAGPASMGAGEQSPASLSQVIADERTNKLIIVANQRAFQRIQELLKHLDTPMPGEGSVHVYYLKNANAEELATTLASLTQGVNKGGARPPTPAAGGAKAPATVADLFSGEVKITADKATNSLVVIANNSDYRNVINVVDKLDMPRRQVFIEAVIMEVNLDNALNFGVSWHGGKEVITNDRSSLLYGGSEVSGSKASIAGPLGLLTTGGFLAGLQGPLLSDISSKFKDTAVGAIPAFSVVLQALQTSSDVNILSTPHILASDNEDAEIAVGQNVPFQAGVTNPLLGGVPGFGTTNTTTTGINSSLAASQLLGLTSSIAPIQRQNVELKLKLKPQISESDHIRLVIEEQTEDIASKDPVLGPTTNKRTAKTTVVAKNQQTVVIGGLIQERTTRSVSKIPLLGDIPVLGWLFRNNEDKKTRSNLLLFLTPYIIRDQSDFQRIFERKMKERQEFVEQFYGRQPGYQVPIDYARKTGPLAKMIQTVETESKKIENGGPGTPYERLIAPQDAAEATDEEQQSPKDDQSPSGQQPADKKPPEDKQSPTPSPAPTAPDQEPSRSESATPPSGTAPPANDQTP